MALQARLNSEFDTRAGVPGAIFIPDYAIHARIMAEDARLDAVETHKQQISGSGTGRITLGTTVGHETRAARQKDAQEKKQKEQTDMARFLNLIGDLQGRINANNRQIAENEARIEELLADRAVLEELAHRLENDEYFEMNEDGTFADPELEQIIAKYEERLGPIDRTDPDAIRDVLTFIDQEQFRLDNERKALMQENEVLEAEIEEVANEAGLSAEETLEARGLDDATEEEITLRQEALQVDDPNSINSANDFMAGLGGGLN